MRFNTKFNLGADVRIKDFEAFANRGKIEHVFCGASRDGKSIVYQVRFMNGHTDTMLESTLESVPRDASNNDGVMVMRRA